MKRKGLILLNVLMFSCLACSSSEKKEIESPQETGAMSEEEAAAPVMSPFTMTVEAQKLDENTLLQVHIHYVAEMKTSTELRFHFGNDTEAVVSSLPYRVSGADGTLVRRPAVWVEALPPVAEGTDITRQIVLAGDSPSVEIKLGLYEEGFSFEMTESWPKKIVLQREGPNLELNQPVEMNGISVKQSVLVKPKQHLQDD